MLKRLVLSAALIAWLAMPAYSQQECTVTLPGGIVKQFRLRCPSSQGNDAGIADHILADRSQTARDLEGSYNCFFYVQTNVLGQTPAGINFVSTSTDMGWSVKELGHQVPGTDYFDESFLRCKVIQDWYIGVCRGVPPPQIATAGTLVTSRARTL
jgi:hypothetical protein